MKLDLRSFKKVTEDGEKATLEHPDGHQIHISKGALHPEQAKALAALPFHEKKPKNYADGGNVAESTDEPTGYSRLQEKLAESGPLFSPEIKQQAADFYANRDSIASGQGSISSVAEPASLSPDSAPATPPSGASSGPLAQAPGLQSGIAPGAPAVDQGTPSDDYFKNATNQRVRGLAEEAKATGDLGKEQEGLYKQQAAASQDLKNSYDKHYAELTAERSQLLDEYKKGEIDPDHYLHSQDTVQKISSAIGLLLGGLGAPATGKNEALGFLNQSIDRDIAAQKDNLGKKKSLLEANLQQFGELKSATEMTKVMMTDMTIANLEAAKAKAASPLAAARADQAIGQLKQESEARLSQIAQRQMLMKSGAHDQGTLIELGATSPQQKERLYKELGTKQEAENLKDFYKQQFDHLHSKTLNGALSPADRQSAIQSTIGRIQKQSEGRYNLEAATQLAEALYPNKIESGTTSKNKMERGLDLLDSLSSTPELDQFNKQHGYNSSALQNKASFQKLSPKEQGYASWAKANPNDPKAKIVLQKLKLE